MWPAGNAAAQQQNLYWSGTAGTATPTWNTPLAWSTDGEAWVASPTTPGSNSTAVFGIAPLADPQLVSIAGTQSVHGLVFRSNVPTALTGTNGTTTLSLGSGGISISAGAHEVDFGFDDPATAVTVALTGSMGQRWTNEGYRVPRLNGPLVRGPGATLTLLGYAPFALRTATNTFGMLGPWASYEGGSAIGYVTVGAGGTMTSFNGATIAATAAAVTDTTGTANYDLAATGALGPNASFNTLRYTGYSGTISGSFTANGLMNASGDTGTLSFTGGIRVGATGELVVNAGRTVEFQGSVTDGAGPSILVKTGSGELLLSAGNSYSGGTVVNQGTVRMLHPDALGTGTAGLAVSSGTLVTGLFSLPVSSLSGGPRGMIVGSGTLAVSAAADSTYAGGFAPDGYSASPALVKSGAGTLTLSGSNALSSIAINAGRLVAGHAIALGGGTTALAVNAGVLDIGTVSPVIGALTGSSGSIITTASTAGVRTLTTTVEAYSSVYAGSIQDNGAGSIGLVKSGAGSLKLSGSNSYTGLTRIQAGTLEIANANALAGSTLDLRVGDTGSLTYGGLSSPELNIGGLTGSGTFLVPSFFTIAVGGNGQSTTYAGNLSGSGTFVKQGAGTLTLTGSALVPSFNGLVRIASGTLALGNPDTLVAAKVDMNAADAGTLAFSGTAPQTYTLAALTGSRGVDLGGNTLAIDTGNAYYSTVTYQGSLSGSGGLVMRGPTSTLVLAGSNSYTGLTRIQAGTLEIANANALAGSTLDLRAGDTGRLSYGGLSSPELNIGGLTGSGTFLVPSFFTIAVGGNGQSTTYAGNLSGDIGGSGTLVKQGTGTLTLTGTTIEPYAFNGAKTIVNGGRLVGSTTNLVGTITNNATLEFAQATSGTFGGRVITTSTGLGVQTVKSGAGTLTLTGTIAGNLTVSGGRLVTQATNVGGGQVVVDSTVEFAQETSDTFTGTLLGSGSLVKTGGGTLTLQEGSFNGTTTVSGGRLVASAATLRGPIVANATVEFFQAVNGEHLSVISGSGTVVKSGSGTLLLSGANLFTGTTSITAGILATASGERLADASTVSLAPGGSLRLGGDERIAALLGSGSVNLQTFQLTIAGGGTFSGSLFGSGGLTKAGSGLLALSGSSSYLGATMLNAGTLVLANPSALSSFTTLSIASGATLVLNTDVRVFAYTNSGGTLTGPGQLLTSATATTSGTLTALSDATGPDGYAVGLLKTSTGTLVVSGSTSFTGGIVVEQGTVQMDAGGSFASSNIVEVQSGATLDLNGQSQTVAALAGGGDVTLGGGTLTVASTTDTVFAGSITGGSFVKAGSGVFELSGSSVLTNATVNEGLLSVNGTLTGDVAVAPAGVLGGGGTIVGDVAVSGTHAPGNSPDISTITGDLSYALGSTVIWELAANTDSQGSLGSRTYDQIVVGGNLTFSGTTSLLLSFFDQDPNSSWVSAVDWSNAFWDEDRVWSLWQVSGTTSGFGNLSVTPGSWLDANGTAFAAARPDAFFLVQLSGSDVQLVYAVPEPGTFALAALGIALACRLNCRRHRRGHPCSRCR